MELPARFGSYTLRRVLGQGATATVYLAESGAGREVALKVLSAAATSEERTRRRFAREARSLSQLRHPGVVQVLDAGEEGGVPWLAMERVRGVSLEDRLSRGGPLPLAEALRLGVELSEALAAIHERGLLHRDLKPDNVLCSEEGRYLVADFGLVKELAVEESIRLSRSGMFQGTPGYWAPEQAAGRGHESTPATDVFSCGATLFAALTGAPPFEGRGLLETLIATRESPTPDLRAARPEVPRDLAALVERCLDKDPQRRYRSGRELSQAFQALGAKAQTPLAIYLTGALLGLVGFGLVVALALFPSRGAPSPASTGPSTPSPRVSAAPSPSFETSPAPPRLPAPAPTPEPLRWGDSTPIELGPSRASTPIELGPSREGPLPKPTWGRFVPSDPGYQVEPPPLHLDGPPEPPPPLKPTEISRAYAEGRSLLRRGKDGIKLLERAADAGHLEAAFLCWLWQPNNETSARLSKLARPDARERLARSFRGGIPQPLWVPVSKRWLRKLTEDRYRELTSGDSKRVSEAIPTTVSQDKRARLLDFYVRRRPPDLEVVVERVGPPALQSQVPRVDEGELILWTKISVVVETRMTYTTEEGRKEIPSRNEVNVQLGVSLEPFPRR